MAVIENLQRERKRKVKSESDWKKYYGSCPELKEEIERLGRKNFSRTILSLHKTAGKTNYEETRQLFIKRMSLQSHLTEKYQHTTIATSSAGTSEKTIMMETEEIVADVRQWAIDKVQEYNHQGIERIYDQMALMAEFDEWFDPQEDLEVISLDEISKDQYDDFVDHMKQ